MNILHVVRNLIYVGGAETYIKDLIAYQQQRSSVHIFIYCVEGLNSDVRPSFLNADVLFLNSNVSRANWYSLFKVLNLRRIIKKYKIDIVHSHLFNADFPSVLASYSCSVPIVMTKYCLFGRAAERNSLIEKVFTKPFIDIILNPVITNLSSFVFATSNAALLKYRSFNKRIEYSPCTPINSKLVDYKIDHKKKIILRKEMGIDSDMIVFLCVARFVPEKGHRYLIEAFKKITYSNAMLVLVGDGFLRKEIEFDVGADKRIILLGVRNDVIDILRVASVFVLSSISESLPLSIQEAIASGLPVIATNVGGVSELVDDKQNGIICDPFDSDCLQNAMVYFIDNRSAIAIYL